jgi:hypothetical protein
MEWFIVVIVLAPIIVAVVLRDAWRNRGKGDKDTGSNDYYG